MRTDGARHERRQLSGQERGRRAQHATADIGRKTLPGAAKVGRIHSRQIVSPKTELSDSEEAGQEDADSQHLQIAFRKSPRAGKEKYQRDNDQARQLKNAKELAPGDDP